MGQRLSTPHRPRPSPADPGPDDDGRRHDDIDDWGGSVVAAGPGVGPETAWGSGTGPILGGAEMLRGSAPGTRDAPPFAGTVVRRISGSRSSGVHRLDPRRSSLTRIVSSGTWALTEGSRR
jgi:hypothetical protein